MCRPMRERRPLHVFAPAVVRVLASARRGTSPWIWRVRMSTSAPQASVTWDCRAGCSGAPPPRRPSGWGAKAGSCRPLRLRRGGAGGGGSGGGVDGGGGAGGLGGALRSSGSSISPRSAGSREEPDIFLSEVSGEPVQRGAAGHAADGGPWLPSVTTSPSASLRGVDADEHSHKLN